MIATSNALFCLVTLLGTYLIVRANGIPRSMLFQPRTQKLKFVFRMIIGAMIFGCVFDLIFGLKLGGESMFHWVFFPYGVYLWVQCIVLVRSRGTFDTGVTKP